MLDAAREATLSELREQIERQELLLRKRTLESAYNWYDDYVNPAEPLFDTPDFFFPLAGENLPFNLDNRLKGELLPVYITEYGLKILRDYSRWLAAFNNFALNALENRVSYVVGKGFGYTAVAVKSGGSADRLLCQRAQEVIDRFLERTDWGELEQEVMRRADRDGEAFLRFFHTGNGECTVRTVEPEHVRSPGDQSAHLSFGVETPEHDVQDALAYWIVEEPSLSWTPTRVPADEIVHIRFNVDRTAKRGYPTLIPVRRNLLRADKLLQNMSTLAQVQATFALIRKHKQYSASAVQAWQQGQADIAVNDPVSGNTRYLQRYLPGTILDVPEQTDYEFPAAKVPADSLVAVLQAELRAVAARLVLPEYMLTSNAENANYSSTLVAEAPAVKHFERLQKQLARKFGDGRYGGPGRCGALWRVLEHAVEWGNLPRAVLERVALHVEPPSPVARDKDKETARAQSLNRAGVLSKATWSKWEGLDPARERRQIEQEKKEDQSRPGARAGFTEEVRRLLEACQPHKSGRFKGTDIGYDADKHNANCRLTQSAKDDKEPSKRSNEDDPDKGKAPPIEQDKKDRARQVEDFTRELIDQLRQDKDLAGQIILKLAPELFESLTPEQLDQLYQHYLDNEQRWENEAYDQAKLQEALATDPELARELEETLGKLRAEFEKGTPRLDARSRREAAPWLYRNDFKYFAPVVTTDADGAPQFAFEPTAALRRLQLLQALSMDVQTSGGGPDVMHVASRATDFQSPQTTADAVAWYQMFGATPPDKLAHIRLGGGLQGANSDWLWVIPPTGLLRGTVSVGSYLLGAARGAAANIVLTAAAEKVAEKFGPAAGTAVPFIPILVAVLGRRGIGGAAFRRFAQRYGPLKQVATWPNPHIKGKIPVIGARQTGVNRARALEVELVRKTGRGTVDWTAKEIAAIKKTGKLPEGIIGHHVNSVAEYPEWRGDPRNIKFVRDVPGHLAEHGRAFQNRTQGPLIDRQLMIDTAGGSK